MRLHIKNGRVVDPASGKEGAGEIFISDGKISSEKRKGRPRHRCEGPGGRARLHRPFGAAARAGLRVQGDAGIGNGRRARRRRHQPRLPAGHRPAARRAGAGRHAAPPRQGAVARPGLSGRRAHGEARRRGAHRDGAAHRRRLRRVLPGERAARRHPGALARAAVRGDFRLPRVAARRGRVARERRRVARRRNRDAAGPAGHSGVRRDHRPRHPARARARDAGEGSRLPPLHGRRRGAHAPGEAGGPAGNLRCRHSSCPSLRHGPRLLRLALPPRAAAQEPARPRRARRAASPRAWSTACAPTTPRWTRTASTCRSPRPSRARPGSSCCCR